MSPDLFTRAELQEIRSRANWEAKEVRNGEWAVALHALADAADWCDAQRARAMVITGEQIQVAKSVTP